MIRLKIRKDKKEVRFILDYKFELEKVYKRLGYFKFIDGVRQGGTTKKQEIWTKLMSEFEDLTEVQADVICQVYFNKYRKEEFRNIFLDYVSDEGITKRAYLDDILYISDLYNIVFGREQKPVSHYNMCLVDGIENRECEFLGKDPQYNAYLTLAKEYLEEIAYVESEEGYGEYTYDTPIYANKKYIKCKWGCPLSIEFKNGMIIESDEEDD